LPGLLLLTGGLGYAVFIAKLVGKVPEVLEAHVQQLYDISSILRT
jgi:hypothetical protein